jgi:cytoskeleton protein RodZ
MNTTVIMDESDNGTHQLKPGMQLAREREKRGLNIKAVSLKLQLKEEIIIRLEADDYEKMPPPVFIKGYIRGYAKLLEIPFEPLLEQFNSMYGAERKLEKALWQNKRVSNRGERLVRVLTGLITVGAIVAVGIWWQKSKDNQQPLSAKSSEVVAQAALSKSDSAISLTDLSKMRSVLTPNEQMSPMENRSG